MMGKTHMAIGLAAYTVVVPLPSNKDQLIPWGIGLIATLIFSIAPDIDDPRSKAGKLIMPFIPRWLRPLTFGIVGVLLLWLGFIRSDVWILLAGVLFIGTLICKHRGVTHSLVGMLFLATLSYLYLPFLLQPILLGYGFAHLFADALTKEGIPLFWPFGRRIKIPLMRTNSFADRVIVRYVAVLVSIYQVISVIS